jgi:hypothetical protein
VEGEALYDQRRRIHRVWWMFRIGCWGLLAACGALIVQGQFAPGVVAGFSAAALNIVWREWARRVETRHRA